MKKQHQSVSIRPLGDRILIREEKPKDTETTTSTGIIIPVTVQTDKGAKRGTVVAVGNGRYEDGQLIPLSVAPHDTVLYSWGDTIIIDGSEYTLVREAEILAVIE